MRTERMIFWRRFWRRLKLAMVLVAVAAILSVGGYGVYAVLRSPLFIMKNIVVNNARSYAPVDVPMIISLARVPTGQVNLFDLALPAIEARLLSNPWIREVRLQKRFPDTLAVNVVFRNPLALFQSENGSLAYVDESGIVFGTLNLKIHADKPILSGFQQNSRARITEALRLIQLWQELQLNISSPLSSITYDVSKGYRIIVSYPLLDPARGDSTKTGRSVVELGHDWVTNPEQLFGRLRQVFKYLTVRNIASRQIFTDNSKKIIVKLARGS